MSFKLTFFKGNSQFLRVAGLKDQSVTPNTYINAGAGIATMFDPSGVAVPGCQNITGVYQTASNGEWRFPVDPALFDPPIGGGYVLKVDVTVGTVKYHVPFSVTIKDKSTGTEI